MQSGIYFIVNSINGKIYVGSALFLKRREKEHWNRLAAGTHHSSYLQRAYDKYGKEAFEFKIIQHCEKDRLID